MEKRSGLRSKESRFVRAEARLTVRDSASGDSGVKEEGFQALLVAEQLAGALSDEEVLMALWKFRTNVLDRSIRRVPVAERDIPVGSSDVEPSGVTQAA